jgi:hypothetical protein
MSKGSISKKKNPMPEKGIRNNEKEEGFEMKTGTDRSVAYKNRCFHTLQHN